jgi:uncharacterized protein YdaU (DUF1376 family)
MSLPYFPMYPTDFEAKTSHLSIAEDGAYNRLLRICWMAPGCSMPADEAWVMRRVRAVSEADQEAVRAILSEFFTIEKGRYSNARLTREWNAANEAHEKRKNAGTKGGLAKGAKTNKKMSSNAKAMPKQPEPEPEYTEAKASDGEAVDFAKVLFDRGVGFLQRHGVSERQARSLIGKWRKGREDRDVFDAFADCSKAGITEPVAWIEARLKPQGQTNLDSIFAALMSETDEHAED